MVFHLLPFVEPEGILDAAEIYRGAWPLPAAPFEEALRGGDYDGFHQPTSLPDEIDAGIIRSSRPRRYRLQYRWDSALPVLGVISCNPSKATRRRLDDTLESTVNQAALWGFGGIDQGNLDPVYETNSKAMADTADLSDPRNYEALEEIITNDAVWLSWGNKPAALKDELNILWRRAEQRVLRAGHARQRQGGRFLVTKLNRPSSGFVAPAHPSPRRFPMSKARELFVRPSAVQIVELP